MSGLISGTARERLRPYGRRLALVREQPLRIVLVICHATTLAAATYLVVAQLGSPPLRLLSTIAIGVFAAFALSAPGTGAGIAFLLGTGVAYVLLSSFAGVLTGAGARPAPATWEVLTLAAALFGSHAFDALRGVLPADAAGDPDVLVRWLRRCAEGLVPGLLLGGLLLRVPISGRGGLFWLVGGLALLVAAGAPALMAGARPWRGEPRAGRVDGSAPR